MPRIKAGSRLDNLANLEMIRHASAIAAVQRGNHRARHFVWTAPGDGPPVPPPAWMRVLEIEIPDVTGDALRSVLDELTVQVKQIKATKANWTSWAA